MNGTTMTANAAAIAKGQSSGKGGRTRMAGEDHYHYHHDDDDDDFYETTSTWIFVRGSATATQVFAGGRRRRRLHDGLLFGNNKNGAEGESSVFRRNSSLAKKEQTPGPFKESSARPTAVRVGGLPGFAFCWTVLLLLLLDEYDERRTTIDYYWEQKQASLGWPTLSPSTGRPATSFDPTKMEKASVFTRDNDVLAVPLSARATTRP
jgi:hypothetical protein